MEEILTWIQSIEPSQLMWIVGATIALTSMGALPSNNDVVMIALGLYSSQKPEVGLQFFWLAIGCILIGELAAFSIGFFMGEKIRKLAWFKKKFNGDTIAKLEQIVDQSSSSFIFAIRITPFLRPYFTIALGALRLKPVSFISVHPLFVVFHVSVVFFVPYKLGMIDGSVRYLAFFIAAGVWVWIIKKTGIRKHLGATSS